MESEMGPKKVLVWGEVLEKDLDFELDLWLVVYLELLKVIW